MGTLCNTHNEQTAEEEFTRDPFDDEKLSKEYKSRVDINRNHAFNQFKQALEYKIIQKGQVKVLIF